ncbi:hypothetical protein [Prochlorococcus marinus]|uniref:hypothetical protein n=1 Tax=Prochlorococcus marinus TaxID=1219 RepID=UPI0022B34BA4|nr:hypothetical protein [Prochlorococcus marinus]
MFISHSKENYLIEVAKACDFCMKPFMFSVVDKSVQFSFTSDQDDFDLILLVVCRDKDGKRLEENDLDVDIYKSGVDLSITLSWHSFPDRPILWQGKHSLWMDSSSGKRSQMPEKGHLLEALGRRLRSCFVVEE